MKIWDPIDRKPINQMIETLFLGLKNPQTKDLNSFIWKHLDNPAGNTIFSYAVDTKKNIVVSLIGVSPRYFWYDGIRYICYEAVDASTRPEYGRRGLFTNLFRICLEAAGKGGGNYTYGFPNLSSIRGFLNVGFENKGGISLLMKPCKYLKLGWTLLSMRRGVLSSYEPLYMENKMDEFERQFMPSIANVLNEYNYVGNYLCGDRDIELIRWRFFRRHGFTYFPVLVSGGFAIVNMGTRAGLREARIVEIVCSKKNRLENCFEQLLKQIRDDLEPDVISMYISSQHQHYDIMIKNGFRKVPSRAYFTVFQHGGMKDALKKCKWEISGTDIDTQ